MESPINQTKPVNPLTSTTIGAGLLILGLLAIIRFIPGVSELLWATAFLGTGGILYRLNRMDTRRWWLLIPAYGFAALGGLMGVSLLRYTPLATNRLDTVELLIPAYIFAAMALPFYLWHRAGHVPAWFALILGGPIAMLASMFFLGAVGPAIPALMVAGGLYLLIKGRKDSSTNPSGVTPSLAASNNLEGTVPPPVEFTPIGVKRASGPAADK